MIPLWRRGIRRLASKATLGHLNVDELRSMVQNGSVSSVVVGFTDIYGRMMGKRFDAEFFMHDCLENGTHCCDYLLACDMNMAPIPGFKFANWEKGYGDMHLVPDLSSLRIASWMEEAALVLCDVHYNKDPHDLVQYAPRSMLRRQLDRADKSGYNVLAATELEYYQYRTSYDHAHKSGFDQEAIIPVSNHVEDYHLLQTAREEDLTAEFRKHLRLSGIPVENSKGEAGIGQHELNVKYAEPLCMSDRHVVYKQCLKEVADAKACSVTFMAKPFTDATGSGCHVHLSLWHQDADGNTANAFVGDQDFDGVKCSDEFRWFLAGWLKFTPDCMPFYAPTVNSYKRFQSSSWAPTRLAWSYDNRTAGYRAVGKGKSLRIECRIPGADVNPYLVFAASLASGLEGIKQKLEPPPCFNGNIYEARQIPEVAKTLPAAVSAFESSEFAREAFGDDVVEHYARFYQSEFETFNKTVTDWERKRYFEMI